MSLTLKHTDKIGSVLLLLLAVAIFVLTADFPKGPGETGADFWPRAIAVLIAFFALVVAYVVLLPYLGFIVGTIAFLVVAMWYSGVESYSRMTVVSIGLTLGLYYTFVIFLRVPLPDSELFPVRDLLPSLVFAPGVIL